MLVRTLESVQSSAAKRTRYARHILEGLTIVLVFMTGWFSRWGAWQDRGLLDFDAFYIVAQRVWLGDVEQAYRFDQLIKMQMDASGGKFIFMPWTYPPQFDLLVAPLALIPIGTAYFLFTAATLGFYLLTLRAVAKSYFALVVILLSPALLINLMNGQNGFLTGGLIGLACLTIERRQLAAGLSLGAMVIKPHLAIAFAVYALLARRWITVITATTVILSSSILCTLLLGPQIWSAFLGSVHDSAAFLGRGSGSYPLFRMISIYAALRTAGFSASLAFLSQVVVAVFALSVLARAIYRQLPAHWCLGLAAVASVLISPYAYDYDLTILGMGMALLLPDLTRLASARERAAIYSMTLIAGSYTWFQILLASVQYGTGVIEHPILAFSGFALLVLLWLILRVLLRGAGELRLERQQAGS
jgi:Glycosyltransferase family 87